ncbi:hypothetical protein DFH07DRAFT_784239 [Mycena maculata]|uniref:Uncharacterized protein n=1 Tax=Mycena maculata TaxID=230809 RepID=A0AAD7HIT6_9AGAR|nr:hypothetical protein DFH07DRAFT_784239 [Mycena maculata]
MIEPEQVAVPEVPEMEGNRMADMPENAESGNERNGNTEMTNGPGSPESRKKGVAMMGLYFGVGFGEIIDLTHFARANLFIWALIHIETTSMGDGVEKSKLLRVMSSTGNSIIPSSEVGLQLANQRLVINLFEVRSRLAQSKFRIKSVLLNLPEPLHAVNATNKHVCKAHTDYHQNLVFLVSNSWTREMVRTSGAASGGI